MRTGQKRKIVCNKEDFGQIKFKSDSNFKEFREVIKEINRLRCKNIIERQEGHMLPQNIGRLIILKTKPRVKQVYSMTQPGTKLSNLHTFGWIYRIFHKERILLRFPELFKFRANRQNLKMPLYSVIMNEERDYFKLTDYFD